MNKLLKKIWESRGYDAAFFKELNSVGSGKPYNIDVFCCHLHEYEVSKEQIVLLTDFDTDGIMCGVIGFAALSEMGFNVALFYPDTASYGLSVEDIDRLKVKYPDARAILTGDVGISEHDAFDHAKDLGLDVLITDHHKPASENLPYSSVCVNPMCDDSKDHFREICGAAVLFLTLFEYASKYKNADMRARIRELQVFAGFGTISDSMPLIHENRGFVLEASSICRKIYNDPDLIRKMPGGEFYKRTFRGLSLVLKKFAALRKISNQNSINEEFFAFYIAPLFNSAKRMNDLVGRTYNIFFADRTLAEQSVEYLFSLTDKRKAIQEGALREIKSEPQEFSPYIYTAKAISGIRGLLAQQIMNTTNEPVLVLGFEEDGILRGSGRAPIWFNMLTELRSLEYVTAAGHEQACGVTLPSPKRLKDLFDFFKGRIPSLKPEAAENLKAYDIEFCISNASDVDLGELKELVLELESYRPFDKRFPYPVIRLIFNPLACSFNYMGEEDKHVKIILPGGLPLLCFNQGKIFKEGLALGSFKDGAKVDGKFEINVFRGVESVQFSGDIIAD